MGADSFFIGGSGLEDTFKRVVDKKFLARNVAWEDTARNLETIDRMIRDHSTDMLDLFFLQRLSEQGKEFLTDGYQAAKIGVLVPVGFFGLQEGITAPDIDITLLGIGNHRYFLFHSAIGLIVLRYFYTKWRNERSDGLLRKWGQKIAGAALGAYAFGVGVHLALDVVQPKSVVFPFFGSLVDGTLIDDRVWLLGNSLWAFKICGDVFALCMASELEVARSWVKEKFEGGSLHDVFSGN